MSDQFVFVYVEDDAPSRMIMEMMLYDELGFQNVTILEDSHHFVETIESMNPAPNTFLLDIHVSPLTGFEMLEILREHPQFHDVIVIALTASVMNEEIQRLKTAGFDGIISKPINQDTFANTLERILNGEKVWRIQ
jgi:two-component system, cell cycle response regulator DivK